MGEEHNCVDSREEGVVGEGAIFEIPLCQSVVLHTRGHLPRMFLNELLGLN